jgi:hypothetical protein
VRTTLTLEDEVAAQLRKEMRRTGKSLKQAVNDAIREGLARRATAAAIPRFVVPARPMGLRPGIDYSNTEELLDIAEGPERR